MLTLLLLAVFLADDLPADLKDLDVDRLAELRPGSPRKDPVTGFVVGGKNPTSLIRSLKEINGRKIADLEADMRPDPKGYSGHTSLAGFLGHNEKLLDIMAEDNDYVTEKLGLTHQALARPLLVMAFVAGYDNHSGREFLYHGRRFDVSLIGSKGYQFSPFLDKTRTDSDITVTNLDTGKTLGYSLLVPQMIDRYGFYEGKGTRYRVEPREIVEVFDFLEPAPFPFWWWVGGFALVVVALLCLWRFRAHPSPAPEPSQSPTPPPP